MSPNILIVINKNYRSTHQLLMHKPSVAYGGLQPIRAQTNNSTYIALHCNNNLFVKNFFHWIFAMTNLWLCWSIFLLKSLIRDWHWHNFLNTIIRNITKERTKSLWIEHVLWKQKVNMLNFFSSVSPQSNCSLSLDRFVNLKWRTNVLILNKCIAKSNLFFIWHVDGFSSF